jgi:signal transduction histidine kinase/CheY-like chemotaxis protein
MHVLTSLVPLRSDRGDVTGILGVSLDITERKLLEARLNEAEKMRALGQLAGGIAHDFNNILVAVQGNTQLLLDGLPTQSENAELAREVLNAATRAADLTQKLLGFARRNRTQTTAVDVHVILKDVTDLLSHSIDRRINIETDLKATRHTACGEPAQLHSAVMNLALNARDAIDGPGHIKVSTRNGLRGDLVEASDDQPADQACIEICVEDTGRGIEAGIQSRVFEPFFTTKGPGEGTGLGLAAVYGCAKSHHGAVRLESTEGEGTAVRLILPLCETPQAEPAPVLPPEQGHGLIMVVEDEPSVRQFATRAMRGLGYDVEAFAEGESALLWFRDHGDAVAAVVLDMIMPGLSGGEVLAELRSLDGEVPVILCSGYSETNVGQLMEEYSKVAFIPKPFAISDLAASLAEMVRPCLDQPEETP